MKTWPATVVEREVKKGNQGEYLEITIIGEDGKKRDKKVFAPEAIEAITKLGRYDLDYEKDGKWWNIVGATFTGADGQDSKPQSNGEAVPTRSNRVDGDETYRNDAITAQVAIKGAVDLTVAAIGKASQPVTLDQARSFVTTLAEALIVSSTVAHVKSKTPELEDAPF